MTTAGFEDMPFIQRIDRKSLLRPPMAEARSPTCGASDCIGVAERVAQRRRACGSNSTTRDRAARRRGARPRCRRRRASRSRSTCSSPISTRSTNSGSPTPSVTPSRACRCRARTRSRRSGASTSAATRSSSTPTSAALGALRRRASTRGSRSAGLRCPCFLLKSNGGQTPVGAGVAAGRSSFVLSGLAGGLIARRYFAERGRPRRTAITLDMGGTSADVGLVVDGERYARGPASSSSSACPSPCPWSTSPRSAPAAAPWPVRSRAGSCRSARRAPAPNPGPAATAKGGTDATVTDANLVLGRLNPDYFLGRRDCRSTRPRAAMPWRRIAAQLGCAVDVRRTRSSRSRTRTWRTPCGSCPPTAASTTARFDLVAFGGAGPLHAARARAPIGIAQRDRAAAAPGVASAFGARLADLRVDRR